MLNKSEIIFLVAGLLIGAVAGLVVGYGLHNSPAQGDVAGLLNNSSVNPTVKPLGVVVLDDPTPTPAPTGQASSIVVNQSPSNALPTLPDHPYNY